MKSLSFSDLFRRLINWFLNKSVAKQETFEEETIEGNGVTLIWYRRRTVRAVRTCKAIYKEMQFDIIFGWDTLEYLPDVPSIHKKSRLSTHLLTIYKQGLHSRYNALRGVHEPDIEQLLHEEVCLEPIDSRTTVATWRGKTANSSKQILTKDDLVQYVMDQVAMCVIRHPPSEVEPTQIDWRDVVEKTVKFYLGEKHQVFVEKSQANNAVDWV